MSSTLQFTPIRIPLIRPKLRLCLVPVCAELLDAAAAAGEIRPGTDAYGLLYAVGNLCAAVSSDPRYDARRMVGLPIAGLRQPQAQ
jgi:hypothetical protein